MRVGFTLPIIIGLLLVSACSKPMVRTDGRKVIDLAGRKVFVPNRPSRIACLAGTTYEKVVLMGEGDKIVMAALSNPLEWVKKIDGTRHDQTVMAHVRAPNIEDLLKKRIDLVFFRNNPEQLQRLEDVGISPVVSLAFGGRQNRPVHDVSAFTGIVKDEIRLYGDTLGETTRRQSAQWIAYYETKVRYVQTRIADIPFAHRLRVYSVQGPDITRSYGENENSPWYVEMAGARMVTREITTRGGIDVSIEQIYRWNPDVIFVGHSYYADGIDRYSTDLVTRDQRLISIRAVKTGRVYAFPAGVDYWDRDSEGVLLMLFVAKKLYPERFSDLDMVAVVRDYYQRFYHYRMNTSEAKRMLGEG